MATIAAKLYRPADHIPIDNHRVIGVTVGEETPMYFMEGDGWRTEDGAPIQDPEFWFYPEEEYNPDEEDKKNG